MRVLHELLNSAKRDHPVSACAIGPHLIGIASRRLGLAANLQRGRAAASPMEVGSLAGKSAFELAGWLLEDQWLNAGIGMAALNSLIEASPESLVEVNAKELIAAKAAGRNLAVIGHFPFVEELASKVGNLWVMEKQPREGDLTEEEGYRLLPRAEVVAMTGTSLINHTFERIMDSCQAKSFKIMLGPSTPLSPILLDFGLDALGGTLVDEEDAVLRMVQEGASFRRLQGVRTVMMGKDL